MKKTALFLPLLILSAFFLATSVSAQTSRVKPKPKHDGNPTQNTTLTINSPQQHAFWLYIDDVLQNENPVCSICIRNLWDDMFYIRVELNNTEHNCVGQYVNMSQHQTLSIEKKGKFFGLDYTHANIHPELTMNLYAVTPPPTPPQIVGSCMEENDFNEALRLISKESFDSSKLTAAKQVSTSNSMCTQQIVTVCRVFSFESNKLEFAKFAYKNCVDKNKYYLLNEVFSYDSSKRELDEYIKGL